MLKMPAVRFAADAVVGGVVFFGMTVALLGPSAAAQLLTKGAAASPMYAMTGTNDPQTILFVIAVVFSALFALNLAFLRHVSKVGARADTPKDDAQRRNVDSQPSFGLD